MNIASSPLEAAQARTFDDGDHFDVLIVGAGISGIDAAYHLQQDHPDRSFAMIERQAEFGGTWRTHRYPGIRSDSDLHTFGFSWKPWKKKAIAEAQLILDYLDQAMEEQDLHRRVRYGHEVVSADWSSDDARWTLHLRRLADGADLRVTCNFLWMCQGYYEHREGYTPRWPGMDDFKGEILHPQTWPEDQDLEGKKVVVIGSGATAATLIPAIAGKCAKAVMLQRSPTWFAPRPTHDEFQATLASLGLPDDQYHDIMRRKVLKMQEDIIRRSFEEPEALGEELLGAARAYLGPDYPLERDFRPSYRPWRQRLALIPDGDMFQAIRRGEAEVVTAKIERFEADGIRLDDGRLLEADVIVTATGFNLLPLGGVRFAVDGEGVSLPEQWLNRGIMITGLPNLAWTFGYLRTSWTMRADLVAAFVSRLLRHMDEKGVRSVTPTLREEDRQMEPRPWIDPENFNAGYIMRGHALMPRQGDRGPWVNSQDYYEERESLPAADLEDGTLVYR
ncbi:flavin-containing monooxygenase [Albimonas pacifica]|uniref:Predicted flavoprotein CzcO associated with the cation diffusion facilitator CzcD n=1 Tax=Albimonas pacifica TaxID=1114924 RepID=A0A1I3L5J9_9RHOB|nr:NAD(P)/FAD-dependent oxidoreductase [Albimonas pacifica]SFI79665.1 Predicted flavoprotein CzcO associated with the cation diffusion facilitator CzcD [Albimonas pacifica]